jgi:acetyl esterase/lipase
MMPHPGRAIHTRFPPTSPTVFDGGVIWVFLAFTVVAAGSALLVYVPVRREPFAVATFLCAWLVGELPVHVAVVVLAGTVAIGGNVSSHGPVWWLSLLLGIVATIGYLGLAVSAHRSAGLVDEVLESAAGGPIDAEGIDPAPAWLSWWRVVLAVPFRFGGIRRIRNIDYVGDGLYRHKLDIVVRRADPPTNAPVLVYIHGGAWVIGDKREQGVPMLHELVQRGWVCVAINYRLSPKATWPDHIVDCKRALAWVRANIHEYGGDPSFLAVSGGSAGGHLSALAALTPDAPEWQPGFEDADTSVSACVPFYGVHDMTGSPEAEGAHGHGLVELLEKRVMKLPYVENTPTYDQASPDQRITADAPPFFVVQGSNDTLVPPQVGRRFAARLAATSTSPVAYLELPRTQHAFDVLVSIRSRNTTLGVVRFLEGVRARAARAPEVQQPMESGRDDDRVGDANQGEVLDTGQSF